MVLEVTEQTRLPEQKNSTQRVLRVVGSLWFAAVLLMLLMVAMAFATVFESMHGTEQALAAFYKTRWFESLIGLLAVNMLAALVVRYPFSKKQLGFVMAHISILVILAGSLVTKHWGIDGQVGIAEGQASNHFTISQPTLTFSKSGKDSVTTDLNNPVVGGLRAAEMPGDTISSLEGISVVVTGYLPDSMELEQVVDDNPIDHPAVEVSLSASGEADPTWIFADHSGRVGTVDASFRLVQDADTLTRLVSEPPTTQPATKGTVKIEHAGSTFEFAVEDCLDKPVPIGTTGYSVHVLGYFSHAMVGSGEKGLVNATDPHRQPNPAIEVEIIGPEGSERRLAFARFPGFDSMHGKTKIKELKLTLVTPESNLPKTPIEVLSGPGGEMYVRFNRTGSKAITHKLSVGVPVESPWPGKKFSLLRRFDHARIDRSVAPVDPIRKDRTPAIQLKLTGGQESPHIWVQKYQPKQVTIDGSAYKLFYKDKSVPLGFTLKLNSFRIGRYPGTSRPRSFESHITITDPATGREQSRVVSMNNPTKYGGYSIFQSSYREDGKRMVSFLSISRDPGQLIVFVGYIAALTGMLIVLGTRIMEQRKASAK